jgi:hypothetical protein
LAAICPLIGRSFDSLGIADCIRSILLSSYSAAFFDDRIIEFIIPTAIRTRSSRSTRIHQAPRINARHPFAGCQPRRKCCFSSGQSPGRCKFPAETSHLSQPTLADPVEASLMYRPHETASAAVCRIDRSSFFTLSLSFFTFLDHDSSLDYVESRYDGTHLLGLSRARGCISRLERKTGSLYSQPPRREA